MPYILTELEVDRVDFVDEGANSAAFIELFKRKENKEPMDFSEILAKMKPEHSAVIEEHVAAIQADLEKARTDLSAANDEIAKGKADLDTANAALEKANDELTVLKAKEPNSDEVNEEEVLKAMPESARTEYLKMRAQKEAAEEQVRKAAEEKAEAEAVAKAATLKSLPVEQSVLVEILKSCDQSVVDVLSTVATAIDSTVLSEVGKSGKGKAGAEDADAAWSDIEKAADEIAKRDSVTKQRAIAIAIKENPELYRKYLDGGKK